MPGPRSNLKVTTFCGLPGDMARLRTLAAARGLSMGALLRLVIKDHLKRAKRGEKACSA